MAIKYPLITPSLFRTIVLAGLASLNKTANNPVEMAQDKPYELGLVLAELKYQLAIRSTKGATAQPGAETDPELLLLSIADSISQQYRNKGHISIVPAIGAEEIKAAAQKGLDEKVPKYTVASGQKAEEQKLLTLEEMLAVIPIPSKETPLSDINLELPI